MDFTPWQTQAPITPIGGSMLTQTSATTTTAPTTAPTLTRATTKANRLPIQLELPIVDTIGNVTRNHGPCDLVIDSLGWATLPPERRAELRRHIVPGLDADLCRCPSCTAKDGGQDGVWWFNADLRERIIKRKIPYCFEGGVGDVALENAA
jgi:hypothetical protein